MKSALWLLLGLTLMLTIGCNDDDPEVDAGMDADARHDNDADAIEDTGDDEDADEAEVDAEGETDAEAEADAESTADADADVARDRYVTLANETPCSEEGETRGIHASPGEEGHLVAVRLTPETYPFTLTRIRYRLLATPEPCSASLAHRVDVFVSKDIAPDANPTALVTIEAPGVPDREFERLVTHELEEPLTLIEGDHLYIALEMAVDDEERLCVNACQNVAAQSDRNYWSNSAEMPYPWVTLDSFGVPLNVEIWAIGPAS